MFFIGNLLFIVGMLLWIIFVLVCVEFLTLLERKILGYIQIRKGSNKVGIVGIPQHFCDAIKLFTKAQTNLSFIIKLYFLLFFSYFFFILVLYLSNFFLLI